MGPKFIAYLTKNQIGEAIREDGPESHFSKKGTPTMGGVIILFAVTLSAILWSDWMNIYFIVAFIALIWMGLIGFLDDYIKVFKKEQKGFSW